MFQFTIAVASACIAAGVAVMQFILPNALAIIMTGKLSEQNSHTAVTWSVVSRFILSSHWPIVLRSDAVASKSVTPGVSFLTWVRPVTFFLIAITAVVTPLGLYDVVALDMKEEYVSFEYVHGNDILGVGTTFPRLKSSPSRLCGWYFRCPGTPDLGNTTYSIEPYLGEQNWPILTPEIPTGFLNFYESGFSATGHTPATSFDVEFRQFGLNSQANIVNNSTYIGSRYKRLNAILLNHDLSLVEGLIVDTISGGVGFRNHSVPRGSQNAVEWEEDILFMDPDAVCVNTNLTVAFEQDRNSSNALRSVYILDRGGLANLATESPYAEAETEQRYPFPYGQEDPKLFDGAYNAAWGSNRQTMLYHNLTMTGDSGVSVMSKVGNRISLRTSVGPYTDSTDGTIQLTTDFVNIFTDTIGSDYELLENVREYSRNPPDGGFAGAENIAVEIGAINLPTREYDDLWNDIPPENMTSERPIFICAAATKMSFKTVRFQYNLTSGNNRLADLHVLEVKPKTYESEAEMPIWGVESPVPQLNLSSLRAVDWVFHPIWGVVAPDRMGSANLSTIVSERLYVPASSESFAVYGDLDSLTNLAATVAPPAIWREVMYAYAGTAGLYAGSGDLALSNLWKELSANETGVATILKLIWTDIAANALVGARGRHSAPDLSSSTSKLKRQDDASNERDTYPVYIFRRQVRYKWQYAIPAFICIFIVGSALVFALFSVLCGKGTIQRLRHYMYHLTAGRILTTYNFPETSPETSAPTNRWIEVAGYKHVDVFAYSTGAGQIEASETKSGVKQRYTQVDQREERDEPIYIDQPVSR